MKKIMILIVIFIALFGVGSLLYKKANTNPPAAQNQSEDQYEPIPAIDFLVYDENGKEVHLTNYYDDKPIIINFFSSTCPPCMAEMPDYQKLYDRFKDSVHFVMIDCVGNLGETKEMCLEMMASEEYTFPVLFDEKMNAIQSYGIQAFPTTYIIDKDHYLYAGGTGMISYEIVFDILEDLGGN